MTAPIPNTLDPDTGGHFAAAADGRIAIRVCDDCGHVLHLPRSYCSVCGRWSSRWHAVSPTGTLWSFTVTERALRPGFDPPFTVIIVELDDAPGTRLMGCLPGRTNLAIGMRMRATFESRGDVTIPQWEPDGS